MLNFNRQMLNFSTNLLHVKTEVFLVGSIKPQLLGKRKSFNEAFLGDAFFQAVLEAASEINPCSESRIGLPLLRTVQNKIAFLEASRPPENIKPLICHPHWTGYTELGAK